MEMVFGDGSTEIRKGIKKNSTCLGDKSHSKYGMIHASSCLLSSHRDGTWLPIVKGFDPE